MGSGSKSWVRVPKKLGFHLSFGITIDGYGSGSGNISQVWVRYQKSQPAPGFGGFRLPEPITNPLFVCLLDHILFTKANDK